MRSRHDALSPLYTVKRLFVQRRAAKGVTISANYTLSHCISDTGGGWITLPSGNWEVERLAFKITPEDPSRIGSEGESFFSPQLGVIVKTHRTGESVSAQSKSENTTELISVEP